MTPETSVKDYGFFVKGTTGKMVMLDRTWYQGAKPDGNGGWTRSYRTMSGNELTTTIVTYSKKPEHADVYKGATMITSFIQLLAYNNLMVPITWVDEHNNPAAQTTNTRQAYSNFCDKYPHGKYIDQALAKLDSTEEKEIWDQVAKNREAQLRRFIRENPHSPYVA